MLPFFSFNITNFALTFRMTSSNPRRLQSTADFLRTLATLGYQQKRLTTDFCQLIDLAKKEPTLLLRELVTFTCVIVKKLFD
jgi:hypothetical protein